MSTDRSQKLQAAPFAANSLKDACTTPTVFHANGRTGDVVDRMVEAVQRERCFDVEVSGRAVAIGPHNGSISIDGGTRTRWAYTADAFHQLVERFAGGKPKGARGEPETAGKIAATALWAQPELRAQIWKAVQSVTPRDKAVVFRIGHDVHSSSEWRHQLPYVRGVVSKQHSHGSGDDIAFLTALNTFVLEYDSSEFADGDMVCRRDPAGDTVGYIDSQRVLSGHARVTIRFSNNEIGGGSANVSLAISFMFELERGKQQRLEIEIPGGYSSARAIHKGAGVGHMFEGFGENVMLALAWAPGAVERLKGTALHPIDVVNARLKNLWEAIENPVERNERENAVQNFRAALALARVAEANSALNLALTLAHFGARGSSREVVQQFAGKP